MGYYCRLCSRRRPNEAFSRKGRRLHECKRCVREIPRARRETLRLLRELGRYLEQSRISEKNVGRAMILAVHDDEEVRTLAAIVADIGRVHPHRRRRYRAIIRDHPGLWKRMIAAGLVEPCTPWTEDAALFDQRQVHGWSYGDAAELLDDDSEAPPTGACMTGPGDPEDDDYDLPF
jgi:hypothetical protein